MILKKLIKYKILEYCIETIANKVYLNLFIKPKLQHSYSIKVNYDLKISNDDLNNLFYERIKDQIKDQITEEIDKEILYAMTQSALKLDYI